MSLTKSKKKSTTSIKCLKSDKGLLCQDICNIIETCAESGVTKFSFGDILVEFEAKTQQSIEDDTHIAPSQEAAFSTDMLDTGLIRDQEVAAKELEMELMPLRDPQAYEEMLAKGELTDLEFEDA